MSSILVNIPDDGWFKIDCNTKPTDKMLCIVIHAYGDRAPEICQFRKADWLHTSGDYFLDVNKRWQLASYGEEDAWAPGFITYKIIDFWKPLGLPTVENQRIIHDIETWFEN